MFGLYAKYSNSLEKIGIISIPSFLNHSYFSFNDVDPSLNISNLSASTLKLYGVACLISYAFCIIRSTSFTDKNTRLDMRIGINV
jgi:hypothetical protein